MPISFRAELSTNTRASEFSFFSAIVKFRQGRLFFSEALDRAKQ